jgi:predicted alpha/beta hydrolase family esterase
MVHGKRWVFLIALLSLVWAEPAMATPCVILVHGLGRTAASMNGMAASLAAKGYFVVNHAYPSTRMTIETSALTLDRAIAACRRAKASPIDFVTHSLGGILVRQYFQDHTIPDPGRIVMLAPPNHGSEIVDHLKNRWWFRRLLGPAVEELGTSPDSLPNRLWSIPFEIGIVAGTRSLEPWFRRYFSGPNDGKVSVESTKLAGMTDFLLVPAGHSFIMRSPSVQAQVAAFLATGRFRR